MAMAVDGVALALFVVTGSRFHQDATPLAVFLRNAVPFGGAWLFFSAILGTYRPVSWGGLLKTWAAVVPMGLILRAVWMGAPLGPWNRSFVIAAAGFTLAFLVGGRLLLSVGIRRRPSSGRQG
jgi:hypothetical protein